MNISSCTAVNTAFARAIETDSNLAARLVRLVESEKSTTIRIDNITLSPNTTRDLYVAASIRQPGKVIIGMSSSVRRDVIDAMSDPEPTLASLRVEAAAQALSKW